MAEKNRETLKAIFEDGATDQAYIDLIDSTINILDDGIGITDELGLVLMPSGEQNNLISFMEDIEENEQAWQMAMENKANQTNLKFSTLNEDHLYLTANGKIGVGTNSPAYRLQVNGLAAMRGRVGTFARGYLNADGQWHTVPQLTGLEGCQAFEAFAHINDSGDRRYALTCATLLMSEGRRGYKNKVKSIEAGSSWLWGKIWNKIKFRWVIDKSNSEGNNLKYMIQMKTRTHYGMRDGQPKQIFYRFTKLWDKQYELEDYPVQQYVETVPKDHITTKKGKPGGIIITKK